MSSSKYWYAPPSVTAWSACITVARWCGPRMCPLRVLRFTVIETSRIMCGGTTEASLWTVNGTPRSSAQPTGLTLLPRSSPKLRRCQSPQKKACAEKNEGTTFSSLARSSWSARMSWAWMMTERWSGMGSRSATASSTPSIMRSIAASPLACAMNGMPASTSWAACAL